MRTLNRREKERVSERNEESAMTLEQHLRGEWVRVEQSEAEGTDNKLTRELMLGEYGALICQV